MYLRGGSELNFGYGAFGGLKVSLVQYSNGKGNFAHHNFTKFSYGIKNGRTHFTSWFRVRNETEKNQNHLLFLCEKCLFVNCTYIYVHSFSVRHLNNEGNFRSYPAVFRLEAGVAF